MTPRGLLSLLIPRPMELGVKSPIIVITVWLASLSPHSSDVSWLTVVLAWCAIELLAYQGRYQVNDLIDRVRDRAHPAARGRARLAGIDGRLLLPLVLPTAAVRLVAAGWIALALDDAGVTVQGLIGVVIAAIIYESLRQVVRRRDPVVADPFQPRWYHYAVFGAVGLGYVVRMATGVRLGGLDYGGTIALSALLGLTFGTMFVTMTWVLEASSLSDETSGTYHAGVTGKSHVAVLGNQARRPRHRFNPSARVLLPRPRLNAWWGGSTVLAAGCAGGLGMALVGTARSWDAVAASVAGLLAGGALVWSPPRLVSLLAVTLVSPTAAWLIAVTAGVQRPVLATAPLAIVGVTHLVFRYLRAVDIGLTPALTHHFADTSH